MGMNFLGIWAYYLSSPFTPILLLFPPELLTEGILCLLTLKIAASGAAMSFYLFGRFRIKGCGISGFQPRMPCPPTAWYTASTSCGWTV